MKVDVLAPWRDGDTVLRLSRQIADATETRLRAENHEVVRPQGHEVHEASLSPRPCGDGVVFIGHGHPDELQGADERPLFSGASGPGRLTGRWLHAFACEAGGTLATRLLAAGLRRFVGYVARIRSDWSLDACPEPLRERVLAYLTEVSATLADGIEDAPAIRDRLRPRLDDIRGWCAEHPEDLSLLPAMEGILRSLVVRPAPPGPPPDAS